jgi:hypothetical protein
LLVKKLGVKEEVNRALRSVTVIEIKAEDQLMQQVEKLTKAIQQLQQCIVDLELCAMPEISQDVRDQREETAQSVVERIKSIAMECKKITDCSA